MEKPNKTKSRFTIPIWLQGIIAVIIILFAFLSYMDSIYRLGWDKTDLFAPSKTDLAMLKFNSALPLTSRFNRNSDCILNFINKRERKRHQIYYPDLKEQDEIFKAFKKMPSILLQALTLKVAGFYFISDFPFSGQVIPFQAEDGRINCIIILNPWIFKTRCGDLEADKFTCIKREPHDDFNLQYTFTDDDQTFTKILLHEAAHVLDPKTEDGATFSDYSSYARNFLSKNEKSPGIQNAEYLISVFGNHVWESSAYPYPDFDFPNRDRLSFYSKKKSSSGDIPNSAFPQIFQSWRNSPFISLYGCQNESEDFAEYFSLHYLDWKMNNQYTGVLYKGEVQISKYSPLKNPVVLKRSRIIEAIVNFAE